MSKLHDKRTRGFVVWTRRGLLGAALLVGLAASAEAAVYKCSQGGKTIFSDIPCEAGAAPVSDKSGSATGGSAHSPKALGVEACSQEAEMRLGGTGRVEVVSVTGGQMEVVSYAGATLPARRFVVNARVWRSQNEVAQHANFTCFTSEDGRRVLKDAGSAADPAGRKDGEITAPRRESGLSESRERGKGKSLREPAIDELY